MQQAATLFSTGFVWYWRFFAGIPIPSRTARGAGAGFIYTYNVAGDRWVGDRGAIIRGMSTRLLGSVIVQPDRAVRSCCGNLHPRSPRKPVAKILPM